ncbi:MAG: hypothetical protein J6R40_00455 [Clostridia bacterium]|nr:hypothetical protein [Clostridia bacterium]
MNKTTRIVTVTLAVVLAVLPLLALFGVLFIAPSQYEKTFYGALDEKYERLKDVEGKKIVIVGGSSVAFGFDSEKLEQAFPGYKVVNFGLYADLGTKVMLDLSEDHINEGDIVIVAPEMDTQALSLYFNGESTLKAADDRPFMLFKTKWANLEDLWGGLWGYLSGKLSYLFGEMPDPQGVYNSGNFNEWGDIDPEKFPRQENTMAGGYDKNNPTKLHESTYDPAFVDYLNEYIGKAEKKGATVFYGFCPLNESAIDLSLASAGETAADKREALSQSVMAYLEDALDCPVLAAPNFYGDIYFYDSNFHLNDAGVKLHTAYYIDSLKEALEEAAVGATNAALSEEGSLLVQGNFVFRRLSDGTYALCDVKDIMAGVSAVCIPGTVRVGDDVAAVSVLEKAALAECAKAQTVMLGEDFSLSMLDEAVFDDMPFLQEVYLFCEPFALQASTARESLLKYYVNETAYDAFAQQDGFEDALLNSTPLVASEMAGIIDEFYAEYLAYMENAPEIEDSYFLYRMTMDGTFAIYGLTELGLQQTTLPIPATVLFEEQEYDVSEIESFAFSQATNLRSLVVGQESNVTGFANRFLYGSSVQTLYLYVDVTNFGAAVNPALLDGVADGFKISVYGEQRLDDYKNDYSWSSFNSDNYYTLNTTPEAELSQSLQNAPVDEGPVMHPILKTALWLSLALVLFFGTFIALSYFDKRKKN